MGFINRIRSAFKKKKKAPAPTKTSSSNFEQSIAPKFRTDPRLKEAIAPKFGGGGGSSGGGGGSSTPVTELPTTTRTTPTPSAEPIASPKKFVDIQIDKPKGFLAGTFGARVRYVGDRPDTVSPTGLVVLSEGESGMVGSREGFVSQGIGFVDAPRAGELLSFFPRTDLSLVPSFEERETEFFTARRAGENVRNILGEETKFRQDPESFVGKPGVEVKEVEGGKEFSLNPEFYDNLLSKPRKSSKELRRDFGDELALSSVRETSALLGSTIKVGQRLGVGTLEFAGSIYANFGMQMAEEGKGFSDRVFEFKEGTVLGDVSQSPFLSASDEPFYKDPGKLFSPQSVITGAVIVGAAVYGGKSFLSAARKEGLGVTTAETLSTFSPLSIKSGILVPLESDIVLGSVTGTGTKGALTTRNIVGSGTKTGLSIQSEQKLFNVLGNTQLGPSESIVATPILEVRGGGGFIREGIRVIATKDIVAATSGFNVKSLKEFGSIQIGQKGTGSISSQGSRLQTEVNLFKTPKGEFAGDAVFTQRPFTFDKEQGIIFKQVKDTPLSFFRGGEITKINVKASSDVLGAKVTTSTPKFQVGDVTVKESLTGFDINVNKLLESTRPKVDFIGGSKLVGSGRKGGGLITSLSQSQVSDSLVSQTKSISSAVKTLSSPTGKAVQPLTSQNIPAILGGTATSQFSGAGKYELTSGGFQGIGITRPGTKTAGLGSGVFTTVEDLQRGKEFAGLSPRFGTSVIARPKEKLVSGIAQAQASKLKIGLKFKQVLAQPTTMPPTTPPVGAFGFGRGFPFGIPFVIPPFGAPTRSVKGQKVKRGFFRTPSFAAVELGKIGKIGKGEFTGITERALMKPLKQTKIKLGPLGPFKI